MLALGALQVRVMKMMSAKPVQFCDCRREWSMKSHRRQHSDAASPTQFADDSRSIGRSRAWERHGPAQFVSTSSPRRLHAKCRTVNEEDAPPGVALQRQAMPQFNSPKQQNSKTIRNRVCVLPRRTGGTGLLQKVLPDDVGRRRSRDRHGPCPAIDPGLGLPRGELAAPVES